MWEELGDEVGGLSDDTVRSIKLARITGLLLSRGFTSRLANEPTSVPIDCDSEKGKKNMLYLDGLLINEVTKFD